ncbi:LamG-like jellyroll fold domain-containing protein [Streptomyces mirabilis]|uniref:LamG-like jellyroll fold domain-containing protein n=1 Tax=Streptomyces mirabilis TaxID=68239 RepID=UPI003424CD4E
MKPVDAWPLDERSGSTAADTAGVDEGTASGVRRRAGKSGAAEFDGVSSRIVTWGPALRTGKGHGFTVAAWVCPSAVPDHFATAVSQDAADRRLRLYVDGVQEAAVKDTAPLAGPGSLMIGRATYRRQATDFFPGAIRDVRVFDRALASDE